MITYNLYLGDDVMKVYLKEVRKQKKMTLMQLEELSGLVILKLVILRTALKPRELVRYLVVINDQMCLTAHLHKIYIAS